MKQVAVCHNLVKDTIIHNWNLLGYWSDHASKSFHSRYLASSAEDCYGHMLAYETPSLNSYIMAPSYSCLSVHTLLEMMYWKHYWCTGNDVLMYPTVVLTDQVG